MLLPLPVSSVPPPPKKNRYGQTEPPTIPVDDLFEEGSFPEGEILEHPRDFNSFRVRKGGPCGVAWRVDYSFLLVLAFGLPLVFNALTHVGQQWHKINVPTEDTKPCSEQRPLPTRIERVILR